MESPRELTIRVRESTRTFVEAYEPLPEPTVDKPNFIQKAVAWLDGKKMIIGFLVMGAGKLTTLFVPPIGEAVFYGGMAITAGGGVHKVTKGVAQAKRRKQSKNIGWIDILVEILREVLYTLCGSKKGGDA